MRKKIPPESPLWERGVRFPPMLAGGEYKGGWEEFTADYAD